MAKQSALELKRKEVRGEIRAMKEKIPTAKILILLGRRSKDRSLGDWLINISLLNLVVLGPWLLIGLVLGENRETARIWTTIIFGTEAIVMGVFLGQINIHSILDDIANTIVEKITNVDDLQELLHWLGESWSFRHMSAVVLSVGALWVLLGFVSMSIALNEFIGFGLSLTIILMAIVTGLIFYMMVWVILLASNLKNYQYDINAFSPADSEVINEITEVLTNRMYVVAVYFAILTALSASSLMDSQIRVLFSTPLFLVTWVSIIAHFIQVRSTVNRIINREKWKTLNKIQSKINTIESKDDLSDKETAERLLRLADIHKRIIESRSKVLDLKSVSTLFSQLMLPLLGLLLGNLDKLQELLIK